MSKTEDDLILALFDELPPEDADSLERKLAGSPDLRREQEILGRRIERYRRIGDDPPPAADLGAIARHAVPERRAGSSIFRSPWLAWAAGLLIALGGFLLGRVSQAPGARPSDQAAIVALGAETASLRRQVALLALQQEQVSRRIAAVGQIALLSQTDPSLVTALHEALRADPSAHVRLAAVDALFALPDLAPPASELERLLDREPAPTLRLALVEWIAAARPPTWRTMLRKAADSDDSADVRQRAAALERGLS